MQVMIRWFIIVLSFTILSMPLWLTGCGYEEGDMDRALECLDGCDNSVSHEEEESKQGPPGRDGKSCTVRGLVNGAMIMCEDGTNAVLYNGTDGKDAEDARQPLTRYTVTNIVDPCGKQGSHDEVLLRLESGEYLALYYDHKKKLSFLTTISEGSYVTTDDTECEFQITPEGEVVW